MKLLYLDTSDIATGLSKDDPHGFVSIQSRYTTLLDQCQVIINLAESNDIIDDAGNDEENATNEGYLSQRDMDVLQCILKCDVVETQNEQLNGPLLQTQPMTIKSQEFYADELDFDDNDSETDAINKTGCKEEQSSSAFLFKEDVMATLISRIPPIKKQLLQFQSELRSLAMQT